MSLTHWQPDSLSGSSWEADNSIFVRVWKDWWNKKEKKAQLVAGEVIELDSFAYSHLYHTQGRLYIRDYHSRVYDRLQNMGRRQGGVVLSGQPGSGKTYTLYVLLLKKLVEGEPVIFIPSKDHALYFSSGGVQSNSDITPSDLNELNPGILPPNAPGRTMPRTWALVNTDYGDGLPPPSAVLQGSMFVVQATAPGPSQYKSWVNRQDGSIWCAPRWTREELVKALELVPGLSTDKLESSINEAIPKWGWAPRDIERALFRESKFERELTRTLETPSSLGDLLTRFHNAKYHVDDDIAYTIAGVYESRTEENEPLVDFKSPYIRHRVQREFDRVKWEEPRRLIMDCQEHREGTLLAAWAFDIHVIHILCTANHTFDLHPPISATCTSGSSWSLKSSFTLSASPTSGPSSSIGLTRIRFDTTLKSVTLDGTKLFLPFQFNFPLLDAFYLLLNHEDRHVEVVVLQMTIYSTHKASPKGYAFLERLKEHLQSLDITKHDPVGKRQKHTWKVSFAYHLMVPSSSPDHTFTWNLPGKSPDSISGPVYIQGVSSRLPTFSAEEDESSFVEDSTAVIPKHF